MANSTSGESVIERFLRVMEAFDSRVTHQSVSDIARRAGLPMTTAHRLVKEMVHVGALHRGADGRLSVGVRIWELGYRGNELQRLREAALPFMFDVQSLIRQHTNLAVRDDSEVLYLERLSAPGSAESIAFTATRLPLTSASSGLVLLAFGGAPASHGDPGLRDRLDEIRRAGHCVAPGYTVPSSTGIAVPILGARGFAIAALSAIVPRDDDRRHHVVPILQIAARGIARALSRSK